MPGNLEEALRYLDSGFSIMPLIPSADPEIRKRPSLKSWREFQERHPTEEEVIDWWTASPEAGIGIITGAISGIVVLDIDDMTATDFIREHGFSSPVQAKTGGGGLHLYFAHPTHGRVQNRTHTLPTVKGTISRKGVDVRGDGGYVVAPPSNGYHWSGTLPHEDLDEYPTWPGSVETMPADLDGLDLTMVNPDTIDWIEDTKRRAVECGGKIPTGNGNSRNVRLFKAVCQQIRKGVWGDDLFLFAEQFMDTFYKDNLPDRAWKATVRSAMTMETRGHPERFDSSGKLIDKTSPATAVMPTAPVTDPYHPKFLHTRDADRLIAEAGTDDFLISPWLRRGSITQIVGYNAHGKSLLTEMMLQSLAAGQPRFGPFDIGKTATVLYLNFEEGRGSLGHRMKLMVSIGGDDEGRMKMWTPWNDKGIDIMTPDGLAALKQIILEAKPDVVVIDTLRSAMPGLEEADAASWKVHVNGLAYRLRNAGLTVVMLHHTNKSEGNRESGSAAQLVPIDVQIFVRLVVNDEMEAKRKNALYNVSVSDKQEERPFERLAAQMGHNPDWLMSAVFEVTFGKVRDHSELMESVYYIGLVQHNIRRDSVAIVAEPNIRDRAREMYHGERKTLAQVSTALHRPMWIIEQWCEAPTPHPLA